MEESFEINVLSRFMVKQAKIHDQQILELNRERKKLVLIGLFNRFFSISLFSANFLPPFFHFTRIAHHIHATSHQLSQAMQHVQADAFTSQPSRRGAIQVDQTTV